MGEPEPELDMALEEALDASDPLRHWRDGDGAQDSDVVPAQPLIQAETRELTFPLGTAAAADVPLLLIKLSVNPAPGCGGIAWPAGEVLSRYLAQRGRTSMEGKNVLELGSGTGLVGLVAGALGARQVWITDQEPLLPIMWKNVEMNGLERTVAVEVLDWGEPVPFALPDDLDLLILADCVYFEPAFAPLVRTLCDLTPAAAVDHAPEILFCYKKRRKADKRFFTLLKKHFTWEEVEDDVNKETYSREAISLLRLHRRR